MQNIIIRVYYNQNLLSMHAGYTPGNFLEKVWEGFVQVEMLAGKSICRDIFNMLNGIEMPNGWTRRSMSVGDVVEFVLDNGTSELWACEAIGWMRCDKDWPGHGVVIEPTLSEVLGRTHIRKPWSDADVQGTPRDIPLRYHFNDKQWERLCQYVPGSNANGAVVNKIMFIKEVRDIGRDNGYNYGLRTAKEFADKVYSYTFPDMYQDAGFFDKNDIPF